MHDLKANCLWKLLRQPQNPELRDILKSFTHACKYIFILIAIPVFIFKLVNTYLEDTSKTIAVIWKLNRTEANIEARLIFELERRIAMVSYKFSLVRKCKCYNVVRKPTTFDELILNLSAIIWFLCYDEILLMHISPEFK